MQASVRRHPGYTPRRDCGLTGYERILARAGLAPVAGIDEAGRGACAGPLVVAAVALDQRRLSGLTGLADSKLLSPRARQTAYQQVVECALAWHVVIIPASEIDRLGLHVCNVTGMRRALAGLASRPGYVLTDGFPVRGLAVPALAMWKGDQVAACVAAASVVAKVTRDRIMTQLSASYPRYGFARHKGYSTPSHMTALADHGPCPQHRLSFANVIEVNRTGSIREASVRKASVQLARTGDPGPPGNGSMCAEESLSLAGSIRRAASSGQPAGENGLMVDLVGDHARLATAGLAERARDA